ncbi:MAG: undecaprenyl-diphosphatase UppP [Ignavibacteria bacterium]|nr:undecaprenyl-diphosphatase UppP [Ignavibacteria bacterium]
MSALIAVVLGIIQGLTEFIPISSTAHLTIAASIFGVIDPAHPERWTAFMATIQLGTLAAVLAYFAKDIATISREFLVENFSRRVKFSEQSVNARMGWFVILGSIPIVVAGLAFKTVIEGSLTKNLTLIGSSLIGVAILLWLADRSYTGKKNQSNTTLWDAMIVGASQVLALFPGASRSGSTIMAGLFLGFTREHAARFSFLLSIPAILGAGVLQFADEAGNLSWSDGGLQLLLATVASFISGYWSIGFLLKYLKTHSLSVFIVYRIALGLILLVTGCTPQPESGSVVQQIEQIQPPAINSTDTVNAAIERDTAVITKTVVLRTSAGDIQISLFGVDAPLTVANFTELCKQRFYDGVLFHRVAKDFVIQVGDPKTKDTKLRSEWGSGGETATGKPLAEELDPSVPSAMHGYAAGTVAMARKTEPNSGTSQFFICLEKASTLPHQYTIFGRVVRGMEVVTKIGKVAVEPGPLGEADGVPQKPIKIYSIKIL